VVQISAIIIDNLVDDGGVSWRTHLPPIPPLRLFSLCCNVSRAGFLFLPCVFGAGSLFLYVAPVFFDMLANELDVNGFGFGKTGK
jgi:hypothetical protein